MSGKKGIRFYKTWTPELNNLLVELYNEKGLDQSDIKRYLKINYDVNFSEQSVATQLWRLRKAGRVRGYMNPTIKKINSAMTALPKEEAQVFSYLKEGSLSIGE